MENVPFYAGADSVDVWAGQESFLLNEAGHPTAIDNRCRMEYCQWWEIAVRPPYKCCRYCFELHAAPDREKHPGAPVR